MKTIFMPADSTEFKTFCHSFNVDDQKIKNFSKINYSFWDRKESISNEINNYLISIHAEIKCIGFVDAQTGTKVDYYQFETIERIGI